MKTKIIVFVLLATCWNQLMIAQTAGVTDIGVGYFNGHQFATFGTISGTPPSVTGSLAGNTFTINFSNNTRTELQTFPATSPSLPANSGTFSTTCIDVNYSAVPATSTVTFTSALQPMDQMHVIDVENSESATFEFLDASNTPVLLAGNIRVVSLSTISPTASLNYPSTSMIGINTAPGKITSTNSNQGFSFVMLTNVVKSIRFIQTSASTGGSWDFTFSTGAPDRGDAPASYGNATHLTMGPRLKLGTNGGDAESSAFAGTTATGDDAVSGSTIIDDDDGVSSVPTVSNSGVLGQTISTYSITTTVTNAIGADANVAAWADWNGNGTFDASEYQTAAVVATGSSNASRTFTWTNFALGGLGRTGTFLRVRASTSALGSGNATGFLPNGEVEDYFIAYAATLPVTFASFNASAVDKRYALLEWETQSEQNNTGFQIEHSADGRDWKEIGFVPTSVPGGNSSGSIKYSFTHKDPLYGSKNYYRLKQIDLDGRSSYSSFKTVLISGDIKGIVIYPNPVSNAMTIYGVKKGDLLSLYNANGQAVILKTAMASQVHFDLSHYSTGVYTVQVRSKDGSVESFRILKQ